MLTTDRIVVANRIFEFRLLHKEHMSDIKLPNLWEVFHYIENTLNRVLSITSCSEQNSADWKNNFSTYPKIYLRLGHVKKRK